MIGTIEIRVNSANPQMPLKTLATFQGSPSTIRLLEVPKAIGEWNITDVKILVKYPDNTQVAKGCVRVGNIWQGTISAPEMSGKVQNGFEVIAAGEDEDGNPVENYILGVGDVEVLSRDAQALKDVEKVYVKFSDELPLTASKGDFVYHNGQYYIFNGIKWDVISTGGDIPTKVSELENDVGYITENDLPEIPTKVSELENDAGYITENDLPTKVSELENDSGFVTSEDLPTKVSQLSNDAGYITENDLPEIPTKVSELENDVPYATNGQILDIEDEIDSIQQDLGETIGRVDALRGEVDGLHEIVPQQATSDNQLADKNFVNSSIATNTANFRGTYESEDDFPLSGNTPNDYVFFDTTDDDGNKVFKRYKWTGSTWAFEYSLNNSSFTANQWATINSGVTQQQIENLQIVANNSYSLAMQADEAANQAIAGIAGINAKIPVEATASNQLADKAYVDGRSGGGSPNLYVTFKPADVLDQYYMQGYYPSLGITYSNGQGHSHEFTNLNDWAGVDGVVTLSFSNVREVAFYGDGKMKVVYTRSDNSSIEGTEVYPYTTFELGLFWATAANVWLDFNN